jgi:hypothetical protein
MVYRVRKKQKTHGNAEISLLGQHQKKVSIMVVHFIIGGLKSLETFYVKITELRNKN